jgi:hypothetical protein
MKRSVFFLAISMLQLFALKSQDLNWNVLAPDNNMIVGNELTFKKDNSVEGTPFLFDNWPKGYLVMINDAKMEGIKINLLNQEGELQVSKPIEGIDIRYNVDESKVKYFIVVDSATQKERRFDYLKIDKYGKESNKGYFFEVLFDGPASFLKFASKEFKKAEEAKAYDLGTKKSRYILDETYVIRLSASTEFQPLLLKKKSFEKVFSSDNFKKSESIMKKNKLKWSDESDIVQLLGLIN